MREKEGLRIREDLKAKKSIIENLVSQVNLYASEAVANYREKLEARLRQVLEEKNIELDSQRILTECAIFADKTAVDEELVRLNSHFKAYDEILESSEPAGRKLDFLLQEMNRETNTIGSKVNDIRISQLVIDIKCELEKIREQIQNIE